jgi:hypothetical protein
LILVLFLIGVFANFSKLQYKFKNFINQSLKSIINLFQNELKSQTLFIIIIPLASSIYFGFSLPVSYDEAWTFINFTSRSVFASLSYYPAPNNHILHSTITNFTSYIPFLSPLFKLRVSSIVVSFITMLISSHFLKKYFNTKIALIVTAIYPVLFMGLYYSYMSRGYSIVLFCFISSLYFAYNIINEENRSRYWIWFAILSITGLYTIPSYLYAFIIINIIILFNNSSYFKKQIITSLFVFTISGILYLPVIIVSGLDSLIGNEYVRQIPRDEIIQELPSFYSSSIESIFGFDWKIIVFLIFISLVFFVLKRDKFNLKLALIYLIMPGLLLLIHSVLPPYRTFNYYGFIITLTITLALNKLINRIQTKYLIFGLLIIQFLFVYNFNNKINTYERYSFVAKETVDEIIGNKKYVVNSGLLDAYLIFYLKTEGYKDYKLKYYKPVKMNADTIFNVDYIILDREINKTINAKPLIKTKYYYIY